MRRASNGEHSGSMQVGGRPVEKWELEDDAEGGENMQSSTTFKDWLRHQPDRNFDPDLVPDAAMAEYLGGTVSVSANRSGQGTCHCCATACCSCTRKYLALRKIVLWLHGHIRYTETLAAGL